MDWGSNVIGAYAASTWRTPTADEWDYLFNSRTTTFGIRFAKATVNGKSGVIILPDDWSTTYHSLASSNTANANYTSNDISSDVWTNDFEAHGAVFLPAAGYRSGTSIGTSVYQVNNYGYYWSASPTSNGGIAKCLTMTSGVIDFATEVWRYGGHSVRLVRDAN